MRIDLKWWVEMYFLMNYAYVATDTFWTNLAIEMTLSLTYYLKLLINFLISFRIFVWMINYSRTAPSSCSFDISDAIPSLNHHTSKEERDIENSPHLNQHHQQWHRRIQNLFNQIFAVNIPYAPMHRLPGVQTETRNFHAFPPWSASATLAYPETYKPGCSSARTFLLTCHALNPHNLVRNCAVLNNVIFFRLFRSRRY